MDGQTAEPRRSEPSTRADLGPFEQASEQAPTERFGPLLVERHRKGDGRTLLIYEWRGDER
jgi:hypothetical protein